MKTVIASPQGRCFVPQRRSSALCRVRSVNRRSTTSRAVSDDTAQRHTAALSFTATAAAGALLAKASSLTVGLGPSALITLLGQSTLRPAEKAVPFVKNEDTLAKKVATARAPAPAIESSRPALPASWDVVDSAAQWFQLNRQVSSCGALLATIFISDKAARVHGPILERLRKAYGSGPDAPVRFAFVHVGDDYEQRRRACGAAATAGRGPCALTLGCVSHTAAHHGLDVALGAFMPEGLHAFPALMLTAGPAAAAVGASAAVTAADSSRRVVAAATRVDELTQLVSDMAFLVNRRRAAAAAAATAVAAAEVAGSVLIAAAAAAPAAAGPAATKETKERATASSPNRIAAATVTAGEVPRRPRTAASGAAVGAAVGAPAVWGTAAAKVRKGAMLVGA